MNPVSPGGFQKAFRKTRFLLGVGSPTFVPPFSFPVPLVSEGGDQGPTEDTGERQDNKGKGKEKIKPSSKKHFAKPGFYSELFLLNSEVVFKVPT